jgi:hypothetical protein
LEKRQRNVSALSSNILLLILFIARRCFVGCCSADVVSFLKNLGVSHYVNSQWCLPPYGANQHAPYPADSYAMGFDRLKRQENQRREPYAYIKFTVVEETGKVLVFSMHESQKDK